MRHRNTNTGSEFKPLNVSALVWGGKHKEFNLVKHRLDGDAHSDGLNVFPAPLWVSWWDVVLGKLLWFCQHVNASARRGSPRRS